MRLLLLMLICTPRIYIHIHAHIDTGIRLSHAEFHDGVSDGSTVTRHASIGYSLYDPLLNNGDPHGHGTHTAAIVGGYNTGVAPEATLIGIQAMDQNGTGTGTGTGTGMCTTQQLKLFWM
jgi:subtilisin family serine protease